jgi:hypothetical protein
LILPQILFESHEQHGNARAFLPRLLGPFILDVGERFRVLDGEADEDYVRFGVGEGPEALIIFLAGGVPEG